MSLVQLYAGIFWHNTLVWLVRYFSFVCTIIDIENGFDGDLFYDSTLLFAFPFAVIIISDCLCQQLLDRTRKVTNPI